MASTTYAPPPQIERDLTNGGRNGGSGNGGQNRVSHLPAPVAPSQTGIWVAIAAIAMMFAALTSAMIVRHGVAGDWGHFRLPRILYINTFVLVLSSVTLEISRRRFAQQRKVGGEESRDHTRPSAHTLQWLYITMALGLAFVCGQLLAWRQLAEQGLFLATIPSSSFFYVLTAVHGMHLLGGILGLAYVLLRVRRSFGPTQKATLATASVYWHFMDGLWVYLMLLMISQWR